MNPITALRLYSRLNPLVRQLQENLHMKLSTNMIIQILGTTTWRKHNSIPLHPFVS